jgi:hypothetical protein
MGTDATLAAGPVSKKTLFHRTTYLSEKCRAVKDLLAVPPFCPICPKTPP